MGPFSLCLCGRREPGPRVRTDPAHAMLEEQLRASASPRRSAMCPTGPAEGSGPRGLSTHRVESLSEAAQGASGPLGPADLRVPFQAAGPDSRRVWCRARCRAAPGAGSRAPPPPGAQRPGQATASARGSCPPAPPTSLAAGEENGVEAGCAVLPGAGVPSGPLAAGSGAGAGPGSMGLGRTASSTAPRRGGGSGVPTAEAVQCGEAPAGAARAVPELGARARKARRRAAAEGAGPRGRGRGHSEAHHTAHPNTDREPTCAVSLQGAPAVTTLRVRLGTVGTPGPSALNRRPEVDWPVLASEGPAVGEGFRAAACALGARPRTRLWMG